MRQLLSFATLCLLGPAGATAQATTLVLEAGPTLAFQRWDGFEQDPLLGVHVGVRAENRPDAAPRTLYAALGYHRRGSAIRSRRGEYVDRASGERVVVRPQTVRFAFDNLALALGGKRHYPVGALDGYVALALRAEYNLAARLGDRDRAGVNYGYGLAYPREEFVTRLTYGFDLGAGLDFPLGARFDGVVEARVSPDLGRQYFQPALQYYDPFSRSNRSAAERSITNLTVELGLGLRLLRYETYDELEP